MNAISFDDLCPTLIGQLRDLLPQIEAALARGITMREIHRRFLKDGRQISESYFHRAVKKLRRGAIAVVDRVSDKVDSVVQVTHQVQAAVEAKLAPVGGSLMAAIEARKKEIAESAKKSPTRAVVTENSVVLAGQSNPVVRAATAQPKPKRVLPHNPSPDDHLTEEEIMSIDFYAYGGHQVRIEEGMDAELVESIRHGIELQKCYARGIRDVRRMTGRELKNIIAYTDELDRKIELGTLNSAVVAGQSNPVAQAATAPIKPKRVLPHNPSPDDHLTEEEIMSIDFYAYGGHQIRIEEGMNEDLVEAIKYGILAQRNLARGVYDGRSVVGRMMREIRLWSEELDKRAENRI
jgi:hypothetical protein